MKKMNAQNIKFTVFGKLWLVFFLNSKIYRTLFYRKQSLFQLNTNVKIESIADN